MKKDFYQNVFNEKTKEKEALLKKSNFISLMRLVLFVIIAVLVIVAFSERLPILSIVIALIFIIFVYVINIHAKLEWQRELVDSYIKVSNDYLKRFNHTWQDFSEKGEKYATNDFIATDLDIVGKNSLFQYLVLAKSNSGKQRLYNEFVKNTSISNNQSAISELANLKELHLKLTGLINLYDGKKSDLILNDNKTLNEKTLKIYKFICYFNPLLLLLSIILTILNIVPLAMVILVLIINACIILFNFAKNAEYLNVVKTNHNNLDVLIKVIEEIELHDYKSQKLKNIKDVLVNKYNADSSLKKIVKLKEKLQSQSNALMYLIAQLTTMWDYRNVVHYDEWKRKTGKDAQKYLEIFYELEMLLSLGVIEQTKEIACLPNLKISNSPYLRAIGSYHPLLNSNDVVENDIETRTNSIIITGSNMSGKTTFIRSIGINLVLGYAGAAVCANSMDASLMRIFTSIRVEDDFNEGISTFYAEINRIKDMIDYSKQQQPMVCFVDEIFKGTNSEDRIYGAQKAIESLMKSHIISFITTHDAQLCEIDKIVNYHFKEYYEGDKILFDYKIKDGVSQTRNAKYLLKMAGIVED